ncbi:hypothetical protein CAPN004_05740 [Capnocytophaga cynodegmi]|uniref:DUF4325 domain-containing protein n=1 Tax=Capnocytophaga cynodegmi TaxID=28189 RepID=UPI001AD05C74|nr:DUF4325 domain-containing protein [Capnocytophaga cynodegmi]GIM51544.1 hypothetical protein CAPN004_05740 [Capnocytophaga cynodegmi]
MEIKYKINIAKDFSAYPAGRYRSEGNSSGEAFLNDHLMVKFLLAIKENALLQIDLTGMNGYPSSFISGSFGKLTYELGRLIGKEKASDLMLKHIIFVCDDSSAKVKAFQDEINNPITK